MSPIRRKRRDYIHLHPLPSITKRFSIPGIRIYSFQLFFLALLSFHLFIIPTNAIWSTLYTSDNLNAFALLSNNSLLSIGPANKSPLTITELPSPPENSTLALAGNDTLVAFYGSSFCEQLQVSVFSKESNAWNRLSFDTSKTHVPNYMEYSLYISSPDSDVIYIYGGRNLTNSCANGDSDNSLSVLNSLSSLSSSVAGASQTSTQENSNPPTSPTTTSLSEAATPNGQASVNTPWTPNTVQESTALLVPVASESTPLPPLPSLPTNGQTYPNSYPIHSAPADSDSGSDSDSDPGSESGSGSGSGSEPGSGSELKSSSVAKSITTAATQVPIAAASPSIVNISGNDSPSPNSPLHSTSTSASAESAATSSSSVSSQPSGLANSQYGSGTVTSSSSSELSSVYVSNVMYAFYLNNNTFSLVDTATTPTEMFGAGVVRLRDSAPNSDASVVIGGKATTGWIGTNQIAVWKFGSWSFISTANSAKVDARTYPLVLPVNAGVNTSNSEQTSSDENDDDESSTNTQPVMDILVLGGTVNGHSALPYGASLKFNNETGWTWNDSLPQNIFDVSSLLGAVTFGSTLVTIAELSSSTSSKLLKRDDSSGYNVQYIDTLNWNVVDSYNPDTLNVQSPNDAGNPSSSDSGSESPESSSGNSGSSSSSSNSGGSSLSTGGKIALSTVLPLSGMFMFALVGIVYYKRWKDKKEEDSYEAYEPYSAFDSYQNGNHRSSLLNGTIHHFGGLFRSSVDISSSAANATTDGVPVNELHKSASINSWEEKLRRYEHAVASLGGIGGSLIGGAAIAAGGLTSSIRAHIHSDRHSTHARLDRLDNMEGSPFADNNDINVPRIYPYPPPLRDMSDNNGIRITVQDPSDPADINGHDDFKSKLSGKKARDGILGGIFGASLFRGFSKLGDHKEAVNQEEPPITILDPTTPPITVPPAIPVSHAVPGYLSDTYNSEFYHRPASFNSIYDPAHLNDLISGLHPDGYPSSTDGATSSNVSASAASDSESPYRSSRLQRGEDDDIHEYEDDINLSHVRAHNFNLGQASSDQPTGLLKRVGTLVSTLAPERLLGGRRRKWSGANFSPPTKSDPKGKGTPHAHMYANSPERKHSPQIYGDIGAGTYNYTGYGPATRSASQKYYDIPLDDMNDLEASEHYRTQSQIGKTGLYSHPLPKTPVPIEKLNEKNIDDTANDGNDDAIATTAGIVAGLDVQTSPKQPEIADDDDDIFLGRDVQVLVSSRRRTRLRVTNPDPKSPDTSPEVSRNNSEKSNISIFGSKPALGTSRSNSSLASKLKSGKLTRSLAGSMRSMRSVKSNHSKGSLTAGSLKSFKSATAGNMSDDGDEEQLRLTSNTDDPITLSGDEDEYYDGLGSQAEHIDLTELSSVADLEDLLEEPEEGDNMTGSESSGLLSYVTPPSSSSLVGQNILSSRRIPNRVVENDRRTTTLGVKSEFGSQLYVRKTRRRDLAGSSGTSLPSLSSPSNNPTSASGQSILNGDNSQSTPSLLQQQSELGTNPVGNDYSSLGRKISWKLTRPPSRKTSHIKEKIDEPEEDDITNVRSQSRAVSSGSSYMQQIA